MAARVSPVVSTVLSFVSLLYNFTFFFFFLDVTVESGSAIFVVIFCLGFVFCFVCDFAFLMSAGRLFWFFVFPWFRSCVLCVCPFVDNSSFPFLRFSQSVF